MTNPHHVIWHPHQVSREDRERIKKHEAVALWFTGLSGSGKSSIAHELEEKLNSVGIHTYVLDGDNIRHGLNKDLDFSAEGRKENIRRIGEVTKLFVDAGLVTIVAFISPYREDRQTVRKLLGNNHFIEIYTRCPLEVCKIRDPKGFYKKAAKGEIENFTGVSHPYEVPESPEIILETDKQPIDECVGSIIHYLSSQNILPLHV